MRTDTHRPSVIVPADYTYFFSYSLEAGAAPAVNIDCKGEHDANGRCCLAGLDATGAAQASRAGRCTVCGALFLQGDVWLHNTGEFVHVGHNCAEKYSLLTDRSAYEMALRHAKAMARRDEATKRNDAARKAFFAQNIGLEEVLSLECAALDGLKSTFMRFCSLTEAQVALAYKLASEAYCPKFEERKGVAPIGAGVSFIGVVVSAKVKDGPYGSQRKMMVKVKEGADGAWFAYGTAPASLLRSMPIGSNGRLDCLVGCKISVTATLKASDKPELCWMERPKAKVLMLSEKAQSFSTQEEGLSL